MRRTNWIWVLAAAAALVACGDDGDGGDGKGPFGDSVFDGSCSGHPESDPSFNCVEQYSPPRSEEQPLDTTALWKSVCEDSEGTYSPGHCAGPDACCLVAGVEPGKGTRMCAHHYPAEYLAWFKEFCTETMGGTLD